MTERDRLEKALTRFSIAITVLNLLGHLFLGFEASYATPFVALASAYSAELLLEMVDAWSRGASPRFLGKGFRGLALFLRSAHITGLACGMLLFANGQLWAIVLAASVAVGSKYVLRVRDADGRARHFLNPSNFGITVTLLLLPSVGISPPYQFSESLHGGFDWLIPLVIVCTGSLINVKLTRRFPLIAAWLGGFSLQAIARNAIHGTAVVSGLQTMTGIAFVLFTFYMVTDPMTTPREDKGQIAFGLAVAAIYGLFVELHIVFGMFFGLTLVCAARGVTMGIAHRLAPRDPVPQVAVVTVVSTAVPSLAEEPKMLETSF